MATRTHQEAIREAASVLNAAGIVQGNLGELATQLLAAADEIDRMKRGDFTPAEIHDFCHKVDETVDGAEAFAQGCADYQRKLFGRAPHADDSAMCNELCVAALLLRSHYNEHGSDISRNLPAEFRDLLNELFQAIPGSAIARALRPLTLRDALQELVACKDLKEAIEYSAFADTEQLAEAAEEYESRKGPAWEAARRALERRQVLPQGLLQEAALQLRSALGVFERNDAVNWDELQRCAEAVEAYIESEVKVDTSSGLWKFAQWVGSVTAGRAHGLASAVCQGKTWEEAHAYCEQVGASRQSAFLWGIVVPRDPPAELIDSMCLRYRHDFGLDRWEGSIGLGFTKKERDSLRSQMRQLYEEATGQGFFRFVQPRHVESVRCGFDRNASHDAGHYVCTCGWEDTSAEPALKIRLDIKFRDRYWVACSDDLPGIYILHQDLTLVLADVVSAWKQLNQLSPGQLPPFPS